MTRRPVRSRPRASSYDVARRAGVSRTTVSFVLNNTPGKIIPESTRDRVLAAARELAYVPNARARRVAMAMHRSIGLFVPHPGYISADPYVHRVIQGMSPVLNKSRIRLVVQSLDVAQQDYLTIARRHRIDGIVIMNTHGGDHGLAEVVGAGFPLVVIGTVPDPRVCQLDIDNRGAAAEAVRHLIGLRHRKIGLILHAPVSYTAARARLAGFREAMGRAGLPVRREWVRIAGLTEQSGRRAMDELLACRRRPTAVFASSDTVAYGALRAIQERGLSVPEDVSVVGFDDDLLSRYVKPQLSTIGSPAATLGAEAARMLIARVRGSSLPARRTLPASLVLRESCRPAVEPSRRARPARPRARATAPRPSGSSRP